MEFNEARSTEGVEMTSTPSTRSDKVGESSDLSGHKGGEKQDVEGNCTEIQSLGPNWRDELKRKLEEKQSRFSEARKRAKDRKIQDLEIVETHSIAESSGTRSAEPSEDEKEEAEYDPPHAIEAFCGKGVLTKELLAAGFAAVGIDYRANKDKPVAKVVWLDLTKREDQLQFWELIRSGKVRYVTSKFTAP